MALPTHWAAWRMASNVRKSFSRIWNWSRRYSSRAWTRWFRHGGFSVNIQTCFILKHLFVSCLTDFLKKNLENRKLKPLCSLIKALKTHLCSLILQIETFFFPFAPQNPSMCPYIYASFSILGSIASVTWWLLQSLKAFKHIKDNINMLIFTKGTL